MKNLKKKRRLRSVLLWVMWVLLAQFVLVNISAAFYADKLTHLHFPGTETQAKSLSGNFFKKTWRLFTGPTLYKRALSEIPTFLYSTIILKTKEDIPIEAWYAKTDSISRGTVILIHGLTGNKGMVIDEAVAFRNLGYHVMLVDLRAHGNSGGQATTMGYKEAEEVALAYNFVSQSGEKNIILWGASMGAVSVMKAVSDYQLQPSGIIIEMPFLSLQTHTESKAPYLGFPRQPFAFLVSFWIGAERGFNGLGFNTRKYAKKIRCPVLMQYGVKDGMVLQRETDAVYKAIASSNKKLVKYDDAAHESLLKKDPVTWDREVKAFLR